MSIRRHFLYERRRPQVILVNLLFVRLLAIFFLLRPPTEKPHGLFQDGQVVEGQARRAPLSSEPYFGFPQDGILLRAPLGRAWESAGFC